jgi:hypothetical protein
MICDMMATLAMAYSRADATWRYTLAPSIWFPRKPNGLLAPPFPAATRACR